MQTQNFIENGVTPSRNNTKNTIFFFVAKQSERSETYFSNEFISAN